MSAAWFSACAAARAPTETTVLGLRLQPYAIGHEIILRQNESHALDGSLDDVTLQELLLAVLVCSQEFHAAQKLLRRGTVLKWLGLIWRLVLPRDVDLVEELVVFRAYVREHTWAPEVARVANGKPLVAPDAIGLLASM